MLQTEFHQQTFIHTQKYKHNHHLATVALEENTLIINHLKILKYVNGDFQMINVS